MLDKTEFEETSHFCLMFDFFDCLNTRDAKEGKRKRKPDLALSSSIEELMELHTQITYLPLCIPTTDYPCLPVRYLFHCDEEFQSI